MGVLGVAGADQRDPPASLKGVKEPGDTSQGRLQYGCGTPLSAYVGPPRLAMLVALLSAVPGHAGWHSTGPRLHASPGTLRVPFKPSRMAARFRITGVRQ
jgi:hypothetical protein